MSLTNIQYQAIMREYEHLQLHNRRLLQSRIDEIHQMIPEYKELEDTIASISVAKGKELLNGDPEALTTLREMIEELRHKKEGYLLAYQYPADYLQPIYTCALCQDTGYLNREKCSCFKQKEIALLYEQSLILPMLVENNFSTLEESFYEGEDLKRFQNATSTSKIFVKRFLNDYQNIFFYGTVGTGKSFLSCCIAKELIEAGYSVLYFSTTSFFELLSSYSFDYNSKQDLKEVYQDIYSCDLLIIDDLGTELTNAFVTSQLFSCINERHLRKRPMIISTNYSLEDIHTVYSDRIFSRITANFQLCKITGKDIRLIKKTTVNRK
ncbi:MAG: ATP-binding protein [Eubacteriales bacterium]